MGSDFCSSIGPQTGFSETDEAVSLEPTPTPWRTHQTVGNIRVSTADQNPARQEKALRQHGVERVFEEKISGKDMNRPKLKELLDFVREGDTAIVESYSRLARSTKDLLFIIDKLQEKKVSFVSLKENIDTTTPQGKLMLTIFAGLSQFERECALQRQAEGIVIAKAEGNLNSILSTSHTVTNLF